MGSVKLNILPAALLFCFLAVSSTVTAKSSNQQLQQEDADLAAMIQDPEVILITIVSCGAALATSLLL